MIAPHDLGVDDLEGFRFIYPPVVTPPTAAPGNVQVIVNGRESVTVSYTAVTADVAAGASAATSYRIEFRRGPRRPPFGWVTSFGTSAVVAVPPELSGTFYVTVVAVNSAGEGPGSSPVQFFVPCSPPAMPAGLSGSVVGGVVTVSWTAAAGATSYVLQAGSDTSAANLFNGNVGNVTTVTAPGWPPDLHAFIRVIAVNQCGPGPPTAAVLIQ
jgi:cellulose 1,4-beta-cellobiosidase